MPILTRCDKCGQKLRAKEEMAGKRIICPACAQILTIPPQTVESSKAVASIPAAALSKWHILQKGKPKEGPFTLQQLQALSPTIGMRLRREGDSKWIALQNARNEYPELGEAHCRLLDEPAVASVAAVSVVRRERPAMTTPSTRERTITARDGSSRDELAAQIMALSIKKHLRMNVSEEVQKIISMCQSEGDQEHILRLCRGLGLH